MREIYYRTKDKEGKPSLPIFVVDDTFELCSAKAKALAMEQGVTLRGRGIRRPSFHKTTSCHCVMNFSAPNFGII